MPATTVGLSGGTVSLCGSPLPYNPIGEAVFQVSEKKFSDFLEAKTERCCNVSSFCSLMLWPSGP